MNWYFVRGIKVRYETLYAIKFSQSCISLLNLAFTTPQSIIDMKQSNYFSIIVRRMVFLSLTSLMSLFFCMPAHAREMIVERAIFDDPRGELTIREVRKMPFSAEQKVTNEGYTKSAIWIRLTVDSGADDRDLVLKIFPSILDDVMLFSPSLTGSHATASPERGQIVLNGTGSLQGQSGKRTYYLRVKTTGSMLMSQHVETPEQALDEIRVRGMVLGAVVACSIATIIATLVLIVMRPDALYFSFLVNFVVSVVAIFGWLGYLAEFFGAGSVIGSTGMFNFLVMTNIFTGVIFFREILSHFGLPHQIKRLFLVFLALYTPVFFVFFLIDRQLALSLGTLWGIAISVLFLPLTAYLFYREKSIAWYIAPLIFLAVLLLIRTFMIMRGMLEPGDSMINVMAFRMFVFSGFFFVVLLLLARDKDSLLQTLRLNEAVAHSLAESEKQRRVIQERFMTMLMHELKTPLAIIQLAAASLGRHLAPETRDAIRVNNINQSVDDLNTLVDRCQQADLIEQGEMVIKREMFSLNSLVSEMAISMDPVRIAVVDSPEFIVRSDNHYVRLILQNLMNNALKYSLPGSMIMVALQSASTNGVAGVDIHVSNTVGPIGMPEPGRLFSRYYRSEAARGKVGAGLGLWLSQEIAKQLGSELSFKTDHDQVVFSFRLASA